jgi:hypothetical protein
MTQVSILCAVTHGLYEPWNEILQDGQSRTWLSNSIPENFQVVHFHAPPLSKIGVWLDSRHEALRWTNRYIANVQRRIDNLLLKPLNGYIPTHKRSDLLCLDQDSVQINFMDSYLTMKWKDLGTLQYFLSETTSDYLFMTTTSSYIRPNRLLEIVNAFDEKVDYAGAIHYEGANFAAGNNRLISRELAQALIHNRQKWDPGTIEDVALGNVVRKLGYKLMRLPHVNISSLQQLRELSDVALLDNYHFRLKFYDGAERGDTLLMHLLHSRLTNLLGSQP